WSLTTLSADHACLQRQLMDCQPKCLFGDFLADTGELKHHSSGLDIGDPPLGRALAGAHTDFSGLFGQPVAGAHVDPHLSATLDVPGHGDTRRLDLTVGHVCGAKGLDPVLAEGQFGATLSPAAAAGPVRLTVLHTLWHQHQFCPPSAAGAPSRPRPAP